MSYAKPHAAYVPAQRHPPNLDADTLMVTSYPLSLHPRATIEIYRSREPQPLKAPCRRCAKPTPISLTQQKLFLTTERLLQEPATKAADKVRNDENNLEVNYGVGVFTPSIGPGAAVEGKGRAWPFVDEAELDAVTELLRRAGEGLNQRCLDMYLLMLKSMDGPSREVTPVVPPPAPETPKSHGNGRYVPPTLPVLSPFRSSVSSIPASGPPLHSFKNLKDLFEIFDRIERGSYAAARLMEAYADVVVNEACIDCWAKHNIIDMGEEEGADMDDLVQSLGEKGGHAGLTDSQGVGAPPQGMEGVHTSQALHALPNPRNPQALHTLPTSQPSRTPFSVAGSNNVRGVSSGKRGTDEDKEKEDKLEKRWRERAKKREAARGGSNVPQSEAEVNQLHRQKAGGGGPGQSVETEVQGRNNGDTHPKVCQGGKVAGLSGFKQKTRAMLKKRGGAKLTAPSGKGGNKGTEAMLSQANIFIGRNVRGGVKVTPEQWNGEETNCNVSQPIRGGAKILGPRNPNQQVKGGGRIVRGRANIGKRSKCKHWSVEEINGKEVIVID